MSGIGTRDQAAGTAQPAGGDLEGVVGACPPRGFINLRSQPGRVSIDILASIETSSPQCQAAWNAYRAAGIKGGGFPVAEQG